jgi:tRNA pseudouridine38-40 synthase
MRLAMIVEYHGMGYSGFQYQKNAPTVQQQIEKAIQSLTAQPVRIKAAGRTDAGVHALGQVIAFDTSANYGPATFLNALNARLPQDIAVTEVYHAPPDFDPRRDAISRLYRYTLLVSKVRSPVWRYSAHRVSAPPDLDSMREAASLMVGSHDFANFGSPLEDPEASTVRRIYGIVLKTHESFIDVEVEGNAFLPRQVRRMVGALVDVGSGRLKTEDIRKQVLRVEDAPVARSLPPQGLCLVKVNYADFPPRYEE